MGWLWPAPSAEERDACCRVSLTSCRACSLTTAAWNTGLGLMRTCVLPCWPYTILVGMILVAVAWPPELMPLGCVTIILVMGRDVVMIAGLAPWTACKLPAFSRVVTTFLPGSPWMVAPFPVVFCTTMTLGLEVIGMVVILVVVPRPETMLLLMILPPSVARDLGTTVMMLPLVVLT